jgi:hypothetical protein
VGQRVVAVAFAHIVQDGLCVLDHGLAVVEGPAVVRGEVFVHALVHFRNSLLEQLVHLVHFHFHLKLL